MLPAGFAFTNISLAAIVVAALFLARDVIVPVVLALFLTFVLAPLVTLLQRLHCPRSIAVLSSVTVAFAIVLALGMMVFVQLRQLTNDLPKYQTTLNEKVQELRAKAAGSGLLIKGSTILKDMTKALDDPGQGNKPAQLSEPANSRKPLPVEVHQPEPGASDTLVVLLRPLLTPITTTAIIIVFVVFFLFQREDLRNRFIRLFGTGDLERTTTALDDAGLRLSRFFLTQLIVNSVFGFVIGGGLAIIGIPSAPLWGLLAAILRFVPYLGAPLSAILPVILAAAVGPDWTMVLWTAALFLVVETLTGQVVEPLVYGQSAGLSPVAIVVAAAFWAWLWGPLGLLISTPLTLCLVVVARHVDRLQFIDVMLGDQPALTPQQAAYQRMLAADPLEAIEQSRAYMKEGSLVQYYDDVLLGALRLAQKDAERGRLDDVRLEKIFQTVTEVVEDLGERENADKNFNSAGKGQPPAPPASGANVVRLSGEEFGKSVVCLAGLGRLDDCAIVVVVDLLKRLGLAARAASTSALQEHKAPPICICYLENVSNARIGYAVRKLSRQAPSAKIVVALLGDVASRPPVEGTEQNATRSLKETVAAFTEGHLFATPSALATE